MEPDLSNQWFNSELLKTKHLASDTKSATIEGLQENQIENKTAGNKHASVTVDAEIIGSLENTLNESSQQDESLQSGQETNNLTRRERQNAIEPSSKNIRQWVKWI